MRRGRIPGSRVARGTWLHEGCGGRRFRNIEIKELKPVSVLAGEKLPAPKAAPKIAAEKPTPKTTPDGWVLCSTARTYRVENASRGAGRLARGGRHPHRRGPKVSHLYTEHGDYEDLHFRVEAKINDGGNSGPVSPQAFSGQNRR